MWMLSPAWRSQDWSALGARPTSWTENSVQEVQGFVLHLVELQRHGFSGPNEEDLSQVPIRVGPDDLMAPGLLHPPGRKRQGRPFGGSHGREGVQHALRHTAKGFSCS